MEKLIYDFGRNKNGRDGKSPYCKPCHTQKAKKWAEENRDKSRIAKNNYKKRSREKALEFETKDKYRYRKLGYGAKARGIEVRITLVEYSEVIKDRKCFYCDHDFSKETGSNLNRIDSSKEYSLDNVKPCCKKCNFIMQDSTPDELVPRMLKIAERLRAK